MYIILFCTLLHRTSDMAKHFTITAVVLCMLLATYRLQATIPNINFTSYGRRLFQDNSNLCSPRNGISMVEHIFPFLTKRWIAARDEINLTSKFQDSAFIKKLSATVKRFNLFHRNIQLYNLNDTLVCYVPIMKCTFNFY